MVEAEAPRIDPETPAHEVSQLFQDRDLVSAAVVEHRRAGCSAASPSTTSSTSSARKPRTKSCQRPACATRKTCSPACSPSTRRRLVWLGINLVTAFLAAAVVQPLRRHHREGGRAGGAHAHRRQHGRHRRHADRHADHPRHRARPGGMGQRALAAVEGDRRRRAQRPHLGRRSSAASPSSGTAPGRSPRSSPRRCSSICSPPPRWACSCR